MNIKRFILSMYRSNCYVIDNNGHALVIDPGDDPRDVINYIESKNLIVDAIYLTHGHIDHVGGVKAFVEQIDVPVFASYKDINWLTVTNLNRLGYEIPVTNWVNDKDKLQFIDKTFTVHETPGHSQGSTVLAVDDMIFSGDTLFYQSIGRTDLPEGSMEQIYKSIKKLYTIFPGETKVHPGHGPSTSIQHEKENNPFVRG